MYVMFFFFQAEDGIRDYKVTGVQTCALPIWILIADDQNDVLEALRILLKGEGHQTDAVTSLAGIFQALEEKDYALLVMELNYTRETASGEEGLEVIPKIQALPQKLPIAIMYAV